MVELMELMELKLFMSYCRVDDVIQGIGMEMSRRERRHDLQFLSNRLLRNGLFA